MGLISDPIRSSMGPIVVAHAHLQEQFVREGRVRPCEVLRLRLDRQHLGHAAALFHAVPGAVEALARVR